MAALLSQKAKTIKTQMRAELEKQSTLHRVQDLHAVPNPFVYKSELWTAREKRVVLWGGIFLLPLRLFCLLCFLLPTYLLLRLSMAKVGEDEFNPNVPMSGWRRQVQLPLAHLYRVLVAVLGVHVETVGQPCSPSEAKIAVCAPHSTVLDTLYLLYAYRIPSAISKAENLRLPLFGVFFRAIQAITVDRADRNNRQAAFDAMRARCTDPRETRHLLVFPEGTCTNREVLITFKLGAFSSGQPVQPVALEWPNNEFDLTWTAGGPSRLGLVFHLLCQPRINLRVHFLPVYRPSAEEQADPALYARNVRQVIADCLKIGVTNHSTEDMFLAKEARRLKMRNLGETLPFEFQELSSLFQISAADAKSLLKRYSKVYSSKGRITGEEFANVLGIPFTEEVRELFDLLKEDEREEGVDFKHLLVRICQLSNALNSSQDLDSSIDLVWQAILEGRGGVSERISAEELGKRLGELFPSFKQSNLFRNAKETEIDFDTFKQVLKRHPEMLFVAMEKLAGEEEAPAAAASSPSPNTGEIKRRLSVLVKPE